MAGTVPVAHCPKLLKAGTEARATPKAPSLPTDRSPAQAPPAAPVARAASVFRTASIPALWQTQPGSPHSLGRFSPP